MGFFGPAEQGNISANNPLGINQAPDETANPGQPAQNTGAVGVEQMGNEQTAGQRQEDINQPVKEPQKPDEQQTESAENVNIDDTHERKISFIKKKFNNQEDFLNSVEELANKEGVRVPERFDSQEELVNFYIGLEEKQGRTGQQYGQQMNQNMNNDNMQMQQKINGLQNTVQQLMYQLQQQQQNGQTPQRDPQTGQYINNQNINQQQSNKIDYEEILADINDDDFYESPKKVTAQIAQKISEQIANQSVEQKLQQEKQKEQQQKQKAQQLQQYYNNQVETLKQQYGEQAVEKNKQGMLQVLNEYKMYMNPQLFPNGFQLAFEEARRRNNNYNQQQNTMQQQSQQNIAQKKTAGIPRSKPKQPRFQTRQPDQTEIEKKQIFGQNRGSGLWG